MLRVTLRILVLIVIATATLAAVVIAAPILLLLALARRRGRRRRAFPFVKVLAGIVAVYETRSVRFWAGWHPCQNPQCHMPIPNSTRAQYCSALCRRNGRALEQSVLVSSNPPF